MSWSNETTSSIVNIRFKRENSELKILNFTCYKKLYFRCSVSIELKPHTKLLINLFHNIILKNLHVTPILPTCLSIGHKMWNIFLCNGSAKYTEHHHQQGTCCCLLPIWICRIQWLCSLFSDFDCKYPFWANVVQKIKS